MQANYRLIITGVLFVFTGWSSGCGKSESLVIPVKGSLTLDGKAYGPGSVILFPMGDLKVNPAGTVDAQGNVKFSTHKTGDGIPIGDYRVMVNPGIGVQPRIPGIYIDEKKSPLIVKILSDTSELKMELSSKAGPPSKNGLNLPGGLGSGADYQKAIEEMHGTEK
jgi:hypothetical protein